MTMAVVNGSSMPHQRTHPLRAGFRRGLAVAALLLAAIALAPGADLAGRSFEVTVVGGKAPRTMHLAFSATELTCQGVGSMPYTAAPKKIKTRTIVFEGTTTDAKGGSTVINGEVEGSHIHGSITFRPKEGDPVAINFTSEQPAKPKR
jgi:hypothetical protein